MKRQGHRVIPAFDPRRAEIHRAGLPGDRIFNQISRLEIDFDRRVVRFID